MTKNLRRRVLRELERIQWRGENMSCPSCGSLVPRELPPLHSERCYLAAILRELRDPEPALTREQILAENARLSDEWDQVNRRNNELVQEHYGLSARIKRIEKALVQMAEISAADAARCRGSIMPQESISDYSGPLGEIARELREREASPTQRGRLPCGCLDNVRTMATMVREGKHGRGHYAQDGDWMGPCEEKQ